MNEVLDAVDQWRARGRAVAVARVVDAVGSRPRDPGATMAVNDAGEVAGSISGGCVEAAVVTEALEVLASGLPRLRTFGDGGDDDFAVGLTCGGTIQVFIEPLRDGTVATALYESIRSLLRARTPVAVATVVDVHEPGPVDAPELGAKLLVHSDGSVLGSLGTPRIDRRVALDAFDALASARSGMRRYRLHDKTQGADLSVFVEAFPPPARMVIFGAVDFTLSLARVARVLGFRVTVCDARPAFATRARFPEVDEVLVDRPDRYLRTMTEPMGPRDAVCVLTHDAKFDAPAIATALSTSVGYIGAIGSRRTIARCRERVLEAGVTEAQFARVMAPIGLAIGARTPEETAVAICAEIVAVRAGITDAPFLRDAAGPIHRPIEPRAGLRREEVR